MKNAQAVLSVKFNSSHSLADLQNTCQADLEKFRDVPGPMQKYYLLEEATGAISGVYFFEDKNARAAFWASELAASIPSRYLVVPGTLRAEEYDIAIVLNDVPAVQAV